MGQKEKDLKFIKEFGEITVNGICLEFEVDRSNLYRGKASSEKIHKIAERLKEKIRELEID